jgi:hypothetical protein
MKEAPNMELSIKFSLTAQKISRICNKRPRIEQYIRRVNPQYEIEMVKVVVLFKRKDGLSREEFIDYYENQHVKLFADKIPGSGIVRVVRRYFTPISAAFSGSDVPSEFDGILEIRFPASQTLG